MFYESQDENQKRYYGKMLTVVGSLSKLFSENESPYLAPRLAENLFCRSFQADNVSRGDVSYDAVKDGMGIGIKTFLHKNGGSYEKVAEFNSALSHFSSLDPFEKVKKIAELRNLRIQTTQNIYGTTSAIYHCIVREPGKIVAYESPMELVDIANIRIVSQTHNVITFEDGINQYKFSVSKSVLIKKFSNAGPLFEVPVDIIVDPFDVLEKLLGGEAQEILMAVPPRAEPHIVLPLYSYKEGEKYVYPKSGLNQWNADGRLRDFDEVYIQIPAEVRRKYPDFFPPRNVHFTLELPNSETMSAKVCQADDKALMSNPNNALGEWLLRGILNLSEGELLTYEKLEEIGLDSVIIYEKDDSTYEIDFAEVGSYEKFISDEQTTEEE